MKQLLALLLALMVIGAVVPAAIAESGSDDLNETESDDADDASDDSVTNSTDDDADDADDAEIRLRTRTEFKDGMLEVREETRVRLDGSREEIKTLVQARDGTGKERAERIREIQKDRKEYLKELQERRKELVENRQEAVKEIRERIKEHQERIVELRSEYKEKKDGFKEARDKVKKDCATNSTTCKESRKELASDGKEFMGNAAEQILRMIAAAKERVESNEVLGNETSTDVIIQLDARAAAIEAAQDRIDALTNESSVNETKAAAESLRTAWKEARVTLRLTNGLLTHANYAKFIDKLEGMETRFREASDKLEADGKDVTALNAAIDAFHVKIVAADESGQDALESYVDAMASAKTEADANQLLKSTKEQLKAAHDALKSAREDLRSIMKELRALDPAALKRASVEIAADASASADVESDDADDASEDEAEDESEDESEDDESDDESEDESDDESDDDDAGNETVTA
jgi:hypothetical protein